MKIYQLVIIVILSTLVFDLFFSKNIKKNTYNNPKKKIENKKNKKNNFLESNSNTKKVTFNLNNNKVYEIKNKNFNQIEDISLQEDTKLQQTVGNINDNLEKISNNQIKKSKKNKDSIMTKETQQTVVNINDNLEKISNNQIKKSKKNDDNIIEGPQQKMVNRLSKNKDEILQNTKDIHSYWENLNIGNFTERKYSNTQVNDFNNFRSNDQTFKHKEISKVYDDLTRGQTNPYQNFNDDLSINNTFVDGFLTNCKYHNLNNIEN